MNLVAKGPQARASTDSTVAWCVCDTGMDYVRTVTCIREQHTLVSIKIPTLYQLVGHEKNVSPV